MREKYEFCISNDFAYEKVKPRFGMCANVEFIIFACLMLMAWISRVSLPVKKKIHVIKNINWLIDVFFLLIIRMK